MKLTALAVVILAIGIVFGLGFRAAVFEAEAKPPPPQSVSGTLIDLGEVSLLTDDKVAFPSADTSACSSVTAFAEVVSHWTPPPTQGINVGFAFDASVMVSVDGVDWLWVQAETRSTSLPGDSHGAVAATAVVPPAPFTIVMVDDNPAWPNETVAHGWLWCAP